MGTKRTKGDTKYCTIPADGTQREIAEIIYEHILTHPKDVPADATGSRNLTFVLGNGGPACVEISNYNGLNFGVWPGTTTYIQIDNGWAANKSDKIGKGRLISNPHSPAPDDRSEDVHNLRVIVGRALRHQAKEEAQIARSRATRDDGPGVHLVPVAEHGNTSVHLHCPGDAPELTAALESLTESGIDITTRNAGDSYREWGEPVSTDPTADDTSHTVITVPTEYAETAYNTIAKAGVLVDATLPDDWASRITWGLGPEPNGWFARYGHTIAF